jgi:hypothetical protein
VNDTQLEEACEKAYQAGYLARLVGERLLDLAAYTLRHYPRGIKLEQGTAKTLWRRYKSGYEEGE